MKMCTGRIVARFSITIRGLSSYFDGSLQWQKCSRDPARLPQTIFSKFQIASLPGTSLRLNICSLSSSSQFYSFKDLQHFDFLTCTLVYLYNICLCTYLYDIFVYVSINIIYLSMYLSIYYIFLSINLSIHLSIYLSILFYCICDHIGCVTITPPQLKYQ